MVLVIVLVTSLITFLVLIISSITYLITLIVDESDDVNTDALGIDAHDFSLTPVDSPLDQSNHHNNQIHLHHHRSHELAASLSNDNPTNDLQVDQTKDTTEQLQQQQQQQSDTIAGQQGTNGAAGLPATSTGPSTGILLNTPIISDLEGTQQKEPLVFQRIQQQVETVPKTIYDSLAQDSVASIQETVSAWQGSPTAQKTLITSQLGAAASKQVFDDFDAKEVLLGGTALHWCKTRKSLDKLIKLGLPTEILNKRHETALHVAVRRHKLSVLIGLLCQGANIESRNENGETPLILACKVNDIFACQLLLVFDSNYDALDNLGNSARHYAANICDRHRIDQQLPSAAHLILAMLNEIGAKRCPKVPIPPNQPHQHRGPASKPQRSVPIRRCTDGCSSNGHYNGNSYNRWPDYQSESLYKRHMFANIIEERLEQSRSQKVVQEHHKNHPHDQCSPTTKQQHNKEPATKKPSKSRLLCIDGGGLRGVIVCQIMIELEKYLKQPMISYFDWIGGTSVGGFLACALCTGINLKDLRKICFDVKDEVFSGSRPYNSKFIERVLKRTYGPTKRMSDVKGKKLAVTTVIADREPCQLRLFRNYKSPAQLLELYGFETDKLDTMSAHSMVAPTTTTTNIGSANNNNQNHRRQVADRNSSSSANIVDSVAPNNQSASKSSMTPRGGKQVETPNSSKRRTSLKSRENEPNNQNGLSGQTNQGSKRSSASLSPLRTADATANATTAPTGKGEPGAANLSAVADSRINQSNKKDIAGQKQQEQLTAPDGSGNKTKSEITVDRANVSSNGSDNGNANSNDGETNVSGTKLKGSNDPGDANIDKNTSTRDDSINSDYVIDENDQDPLMWQAVRASAAAPFFFKPYGPYLDGGIISNNPTLDMLSEFNNYQKVREFIRKRSLISKVKTTVKPTKPGDKKQENTKKKNSIETTTEECISEPASKMDLVVSLGTGRGRVIGRQAMVDFGQVASGFATVFSPRELVRSIRAARDLFRKLMQQSCHTEDHILDRAQAWCSSLDIPYFRINPALATIFSIDDKRDEQLINALWQTKLYMKAMSPQLKELADILNAQQ